MKLDSQLQPPVFPVGQCRDARATERPKSSLYSLPSPRCYTTLSPRVGVSPGGPSQGAPVEKTGLKD